MGYLGAKRIPILKVKPNFVKITKAGFYESMVHNVDEVKSDNKYYFPNFLLIYIIFNFLRLHLFFE